MSYRILMVSYTCIHLEFDDNLSTCVVTENQIIPPTPNVTSPVKETPVNIQHIPAETPPGPITYASILKVPVSLNTNKPVTQQTEVVSIVNEDKRSKEKPQQSKYTYSHALISPSGSRDVTRTANPSVENPGDSMEVDTPQKNVIPLQINVTLPTQPITYSQVLKHPVINAIQTEVVNEQDNICKEIAPDSLTYSQVLSGKKVDTTDKNILMNGINEAVGLTNNNTSHNAPFDPQNKVPL